MSVYMWYTSILHRWNRILEFLWRINRAIWFRVQKSHTYWHIRVCKHVDLCQLKDDRVCMIVMFVLEFYIHMIESMHLNCWAAFSHSQWLITLLYMFVLFAEFNKWMLDEHIVINISILCSIQKKVYKYCALWIYTLLAYDLSENRYAYLFVHHNG